MSQNITHDGKTGWYSHKLEPEAGLLYRHHPTKGIQWFSLSVGKWRASEDDSCSIDRWVEYEDTKDDPQEDDQ